MEKPSPKRQSRKTASSDRFLSSIGNYVLVVAQAVRSLILASFLAPSSFGQFSIANSSANFTQYGDLGAGTHGELQASAVAGLNQSNQSRDWLNIAYTTRLILGALLSLVLLAAFALLHFTPIGSSTLKFVLVYVAVASPLQAYWLSLRGLLRVEFRFSELLRLQIGQGIVWVTIVPVLAWFFGIYGALAGLLASYIPALIWGAILKQELRLTRRALVVFPKNFSKSISIWLLYVTSFCLLYIDQLIVSANSISRMGYLSLGLLVASAIAAVSDGAAASMHPRTVEEYARVGRLRWDTPTIGQNVRWVSRVFSILLPLAWLGTSVIVDFWLRDYQPGLLLLLAAPTAATLLGLTVATNATLLVHNAHRWVPLFGITAILFKLVASVVIGIGNLTDLSITLVMLSGAVFYTMMYLDCVRRTLKMGVKSLTFLLWSVSRSLVGVLFLLIFIILDSYKIAETIHIAYAISLSYLLVGILSEGFMALKGRIWMK